MFSVGASKQRGLIAAYAERVDEAAAPRIWYFPSRGGAQPSIEPATETRVLDEGVRLGEPHAPGRYRVHVWISDTPIAARTSDELARQPRGSEILLEIVE
jgi:hypothetical protein